MALSRHPQRVGPCPLPGVKQTSNFLGPTSVFDPKATFRALIDHVIGNREYARWDGEPECLGGL
jgi:hypothetical protein